ncbi:DUF559 domain-containing protein [Sphingomonas sp. S1-29]|nr:DUF559 domain-containing protein [Sphingomonas sp. S1-29]
MPRIAPAKTQRARALRRESTPEERLVWLRLREHRPRFTRQLPVGPYILDFACRSTKLAVEIDGGQHADSEQDERRTAFLASLGWRVLRFWNSDVRENADGVVEAILAATVDDRGPTHPQPLPSREGS